MLNFLDALHIVLSSSERLLPTETVPLVLSLDRVLAESIVASENIPADANSAMDGYAVHAEDLTTATVETPVELSIIGESAAGSVFSGTVGRGQAVRIMTGGVIPDGANAVIEVESTSESDGLVLVRRALTLGTAVRPVGEDIRSGEVAISAGKFITPGDIGVLASLGVTNVPVRVKPKVGILSTGNEVVDAFRKPARGQVRNSSSPALYAACAAAGAEPIDLGIAGDTHDLLSDSIEHALRFDILLTTGGVSAGAYDLVQHILPELGVEVRFHHTNIRPGRPMLFGTYGHGNQQTLVFGLPGNPVSSLVTFQQYVMPVIHKMLGLQAAPYRLRAALAEPITKRDGKRHFIRGILHSDELGTLYVSTTGTQSSGAMSSMSRANCLIVVEEETEQIDVGQMVMVELL